ncbi:histidinol-phosphate transaminase [Pandoraea pnomenusa]|uniref:histidinol-phosphate transaminase n=1 Tax=Pandoraea pnomenusa TaxID=93220 RepID=UPI00114759C9|nr:histidinol-phosphate transaminase [Pandoraea pnomenusa]MBN9094091.1 histidinol-phosphate transaminase [Pandoraea pnomenusa]QDH61641.1 histidinol-phosphate transaminase [Pandoraea pnomenusa]
MSVDQVIRPDVLAMSTYPVPDATGFLKLDAMENPYGLPQALRTELGRRLADVALNRYPAPRPQALLEKLSRAMEVPAGMKLLLGNGSDEIINMIAMATARPGAAVIAPMPGFVMYEMSSRFAGIEFVGVPLRPDFSLDMPAMLNAIAAHPGAVVYLAYPNNPTGNLFADDDIETLVRAADRGLVVIDEAYQPFAGKTWMPRLPEFPNLLVMRTVSKLGLAGIRLGYVAGGAHWLDQLDKVRPPYNVNVLTQACAEFMLDHLDVLDAQAAELRAQRERLSAAVAALPGVHVFPSDANFLLVRVPDADKTHAGLLAHKVLIKNVGKMHVLLANCLRLTVGTPTENTAMVQALAASL